MNSFFPPPFPFFRPYYHNSYNPYTAKQDNRKFDKNQTLNSESNNKIDNKNFSKNNNRPFKVEKNSITDNLKSNTISSNSFNPFYNLIPKSFGPLNINVNGFSDSNEAIFELFGIRLFLDDIIIICILFFLYQEDVKDGILYIILIMLLFS